MIRIYCGGLTNTIWAAARTRTDARGLTHVVGRKDDVTQETIGAVLEHMAGCKSDSCLCKRAAEVVPA